MSTTTSEIPVVVLSHPTGRVSATVSLLGATVTEWNMFGQNLLFLSKKAVFDGSKPIRGGMPIVFPQFGPGKLRQHGFARNMVWEHLVTETEEESGDVAAQFRLKSNEETMSVWPHAFEIIYTVVLGMSNLRCEMKIVNTGDAPFSFQTLLHTYFHTDNLLKTTVSGLSGLDYIDSADYRTVKTERQPVISFNGEYVDRIYKRDVMDHDAGRSRAEALLSIGDGGNCDLVIRAASMPDAVVWNPGADKCREMADMEENGFKDFVCVEVGSVTKPVTLEAGAEWNGGQSIILRILSSASAQLRRATAEEALKQFPPRPELEKILPAKSDAAPAAPVDEEKEESANESTKIEIVEED